MKFCFLTTQTHAPQAARQGLILGHLAYGMGREELYLTSSALPLGLRGGWMGLCDDFLPQNGDPARFAAEVAAECRTRRYEAVLADFEQPPGTRAFQILAAVEAALRPLGLPLVVPEGYGDALATARVLVSSAVTTGSYQDYLAEKKDHWPGRAVLELRRLRLDLRPAAGEARAVPVSDEALQARLETAVPYYSHALACNYCTWQEDGEAHFLVYDTVASLLRKLEIAEDLGYPQAVALYPEMEELALRLFPAGK